MTERQREMNVGLAVNFMEEIKMLASSVTEDVSDSDNMTEAWNKIDRFYKDVESMWNKQKCTGSKSESESNMNVNIGDKVKIEATIVDYNEGAKTVKIRIEGLQEDGYTSTERYIRVKSENFEKITNASENEGYITEKSFDTIVSCLINSQITAMKFNRNGINDAYVENINSALSELKEMKNNGKITQ